MHIQCHTRLEAPYDGAQPTNRYNSLHNPFVLYGLLGLCNTQHYINFMVLLSKLHS